MRLSVTLTEEMSKFLDDLAKRWNINRSEAMRRLFCAGKFYVEYVYNSDRSKDGKKEVIKVVQIDT